MEDSLEAYLTRKYKECETLENRFLHLSEILYMAAIISSTIAAIAGALSNEYSISVLGLAVIGALPGVCITIENRFRLRARSDWNASYKIGYQALLRQLTLEGKTPAEVSPLVSKFEIEMEDRYPVGASKLPSLGR